jgi:hypothetical protein
MPDMPLPACRIGQWKNSSARPQTGEQMDQHTQDLVHNHARGLCFISAVFILLI